MGSDTPNGKEGLNEFEFRCSECGEIHRGSPSFSYDMPVTCLTIPEEERAKRITLTSDLCAIDNDNFFIRAVLELPIIGAREPFSWGVWVSQSRESFDRYKATIGTDQGGQGSFGWLFVTMPGYAGPSTGSEFEALACDVRWRSSNLRPLVVPHRCDHRLYADFAQGISWQRATELAQLAMHGEEEADAAP